ncbi:TetR/AcrR family transcriptional regulator [Labrys monachus]|uniref:TetR/AcrR family transcriptional repressor of nem operon n=1 Tax=Labrys monachus TaxID=217067 RepID=A0ABU0FN17_9HYPH|nr:TetR/AcrR family transcriptional regulator [Labrys monachus]MDQ0395866.1 TetR/AcrR family transcriptional repressor of nem operon [Labrys monachus]
MARQSNREKILIEGLRVVHRHGFAGASVRDIVQAAGVPQGSFTNHFASKEAFALEILDLYYANNAATIAETLRNDALPPLQRLAAYIDAGKNRLNRDNMRNGCLFGNLTAEATDQSEVIRQRLLDIFAEVKASVAYCLKAAVAAGELPPGFECDEVAGFVVSSLQGANLLAKAHRDPEPVERFKRLLFSKILR